MHECQDCGHQFTVGSQNDADVQAATQCPSCYSYHTQPFLNQPSPTESDMTHGLKAMPQGTQDDMSGNPLQEGILGDYQNRDRRDESWGGGTTGHRISLFETPEFETTQIVAPPDLYRQALETEAAHRANVQIPHGITDNLHATLGNLGAWIENPYENRQLRPYNQYWKAVRPSFMKPGSIQIGVADPTMAEIINHVAETDDTTPLYEYRGKSSHVKTSGPLAALLPEGIAAGLAGGGADAAAAGAAASGEAAAAGASASGVGGVMKGVLNSLSAPLGMVDDLIGAGGNSGAGVSGGGTPINDGSFYSRIAGDEDDANPNRHDEIPKQDDGDYHQQDDGNQDEWQRDISVNGTGGTDHSPSFDPAGPAFERFMMLLPLIQQLLDSGEDGSQDPLIKGLHDSLDAEIPGYLDHGDDAAGQQLLMILSPKNEASEAPGSPSKAHPDHNEPDHADENAGGGHESKVASLSGEAAEFLPDFVVTLPSLRGASFPSEMGPQSPAEANLFSENWPESQVDACPYCGHMGKTALGLCAGCGREVYQDPGQQGMAYEHTGSTQGPVTPEQIQVVQQWLVDNGDQLGLQGQELIDTVLSVPTNPLPFADILAQIQGKDSPPVPSEDAGMSSAPPMPAQESAPPGATMPMPGMDTGAQMMSAVRRYADIGDGIHVPQDEDQFHLTTPGYPPLPLGPDSDLLIPEPKPGTNPHDPRQRQIRGQPVPHPQAGDWGVTDDSLPGYPNANPHVNWVPKTRMDKTGPIMTTNGDWQPSRMWPPDPSSDAGAAYHLSPEERDALNLHYPKYQGKVAADSVADKCPDCDSHTTKLLSEVDGTSRCHACGHIFKTKGVIPHSVNNGAVSSASTWNVDQDLRKEADALQGSPHGLGDADPEPVQGVPIADQQHPEDLREEQDSGHTWLDEDGNPLKVGQEYEMYSSTYDIPDLVRIEAVKPDSLTYTLTGEFGLEHSTELSREEANIEQITFSSTQSEGELGSEDDDSFEQNNDDNTGFTEPGTRDMSAPHGMVSASVVASGVSNGNPRLAWLGDFPKTAGANYTAYEQRALIDERGTARNADRLDLLGTHYVQDAEEDQFLFGL